MTANTNLESQVLDALRTVEDPDLKRDLVTLGMIQGMEVSSSGEVSFKVVLTTPACPLKGKIENDVRTAVGKVPGVKGLKVEMTAQTRQKAQTGSKSIENVSHIIAVSSGKGGVGKSTVAVNLAMSLARAGAKVGIMDADVYGPNIPTMMGVTEGPKVEHHPTEGEKFIPPIAHGIKVMSMGFLIQGDQPLVWRGPMLHNVVSQFCHKVTWAAPGEQLDYLVVDMPPGTGDVQLSLAQLVPVTGAVLVTTPQEVSMQDVRKAFHMFEKVRIPILGLVENMSYFQAPGSEEKHYIFGKDGGKTLAKKFNLDLLAEIPMVQAVREGGDEGRPITMRDPSGAVAQTFVELAGKIARKVSILSAEQYDPSQIVQIGRFN